MILNGFKADCQARGLTTHTIQTYTGQVKSFLKAYPDPSSVNLDKLRSFLGDLRAKDLDSSTLKGYFAAISALYDYLLFEGRIESNPIPSFRKRYLSRMKLQSNGENSRQLISTQDMQILISSAPDIRAKTLILFLAKTGMRRGEVLSLRIDDVDLKRKVVRIPAKAKRSNRLSFIDYELADFLEQYLSWRQKKAKTSWFWITSSGGRIHKDDPGKIIASLGAAMGVHDPKGPLCQRLTPHCFRHFFTTTLFRSGMDPQFIKFLRGDSLSSEAWQIYNHIDVEDVRNEYEKTMPELCAAPRKTEVKINENSRMQKERMS